jgi:hypothetical protein
MLVRGLAPATEQEAMPSETMKSGEMLAFNNSRGKKRTKS